MKTYLIYKDYLSGEHNIGYTYKSIKANNDFEAVTIADTEWFEEHEKLYLMRIMIADNKPNKIDASMKVQRYKAVLCKRSDRGWHKNDEEHCENKHYANRYYTKDFEFCEAIDYTPLS